MNSDYGLGEFLMDIWITLMCSASIISFAALIGYYVWTWVT